MVDREELVQQYLESRKAMLVHLDEIDRDRKIYPLWTIREMLAHLSGWDDAIIATLNAHAQDQDLGMFAALGVDEYNAKTVSTREGLGYDHIYREYIATRVGLLEAIRNMPDDKLETEMLLPWGGRGTLSQIVKIFSGHELEHATDLEKLIRESKG